MPRNSRKNIVALYVHVITQGIRKEYIFEKANYKKEYIKLIKNKIIELRELDLNNPIK